MANRGDSFDPELATAIQAHQKGAFPEAERLYRSVLKRQPTHGAALQNLGILFAQTGRMLDAVGQFQIAVKADPSGPGIRVFLGNALKDSGDLSGAIQEYQTALRLDPKALPVELLLANSLLKLSKPAEAIPHYKRCLSGSQPSPDLLINLGLALIQVGEFGEAIQNLKRATQLNPRSASAWLNLGDAYLAEKEFRLAIEALDTGLRFSPGDVSGWSSLCEAHTGAGDYERAIVAADKALKLDPTDPKSIFLRSQCLQLNKKSDDAAAGYREVLKLVPDQASARFNLAIILGEQSRTEEARNEFRIVGRQTSEPVSAAALVRAALIPPIIAQSVDQISEFRIGLSKEIQSLCQEPTTLLDPQTQIGNPAFYLAYQGENNRDLMREIAGLLTSMTPDLEWVAPHCNESRNLNTKVKVAFISAHLREHTVGRITAGLIRHLDRSRFDVWVMRPIGSSDAYSKEIDAMADHVVELPGDFREARKIVAEHRLDAIYYPDIGMEPFTYYLAFSRLAHLQAVGWGHADTAGIRNVDVYLSSVHFEPANGQEQYSEKLVCLPRINCFYPKPASEFATVSRSELLLPEKGPLYICPQSAFKFHPEFDEALDELLRLDPKGTVALSSGTEPHWNELLSQRFQRTIPDRQDRIRFIPRVAPEKFRGLLALADAIIDPKHFTGGHTTYMAFADGNPVVTWDGTHMRGRMTRGLYEQMGMAGPVAKDAQEYAQLATRLANDSVWRLELSNEISAKSSDLFEDLQAVREFEDALLQVL